MKKFIVDSDKIIKIFDDSLLFNGFYTGKYIKDSFLIVDGNKYTGWYKDNFGFNNKELLNKILFENNSGNLNEELTKEDIILLNDNEFLFYENGLLFDGIYHSKKLSYIAFKNGRLNNDFVVHKQSNIIIILKDGFLFNGYYEDILYSNGLKTNNIVDGIQFKNGVPLNGIDYYSEHWFKDGILLDGYDEYTKRYFKKGLYIDGIVDIDGKGFLYYKNGKIYTGEGEYTGEYYWKGHNINYIKYLYKKIFNHEK